MSERPRRVAFTTLGCKVNRAEAEQAAAAAAACGADLVAPDDADLVVVSACAVTGEASHKTRKAVRHALGLPSRPVVIVTGCMTGQDADIIASLGDRVLVEREKGSLVERLRGIVGVGEPAVPAPRTGPVFRTRALLKVQDGCDSRCSYCIVPETRGAPRSVPVAEVLREAEELIAAGAREIVLTGINVGRYEDEGTDLAGLIERIAATGVPRIRLTSIEPGDLTERFVRAVSRIPAFVEHLHVPLQSGCDRTLAAMGRRYTAQEYARAIARAREAIPGLAVTTDVICGFPGETERDALASERFVERTGFAKLHVFRYSPRPGTPAAARRDRVQAPVAAVRAARMRKIGDAARERFLAGHVGRTVEVLVERQAGGEAVGTARDGARVHVRGAEVEVGGLVSVCVDAIDGTALRGTVA